MAAAQLRSARSTFCGGAVLSGRRLPRVEQGMLAAAVGAHGPARDPHGDHDGDREDDEQHGDGEPAAGYRRPLLGDAVEQVFSHSMSRSVRDALG